MSWEFDFLYALQNIHNPVLDKIMIVLSTIGDAGLFWIGVAILLICMKKYRKCGLQVAVAMLLTFIVGNLILKNMIHRDRPCWIDPSITLLVKSPSDFSFPSGHTLYRSSRRPYRQPPTVDLPSRQIWLRHWSLFHGFITSSVFRPMSGVSASR